MRERVFGIETEYALIYHPGRGERVRPTNLAIYPRFEAALRHRVRSLSSAFSPLRAKGGRFLENGASFHYEATPESYEHGLLEMASPECRDPYTLLEHERAKDELVEELAAEVTEELRLAGYTGEVRIGKNNVDSAGHTFGSHESYWVEDPIPWSRLLPFLPAWLALWIPSLPVVAWVLLAQVAVLLGLVAGGLGLMGTTVVLGILRPAAARRIVVWIERRVARVESLGGLTRNVHRLVTPLYPLLALHSWLYGLVYFRPFQHFLTAHLVTRSVYAGGGAVAFDGGPLFRVAQRPPFLRALARIFPVGEERPIYELRDLFFRPWTALQRRRRLHLMVGDANLCEWAQVLRTGTTALVLEAIEADAGIVWPELRDPLAALRELSDDPDLRCTLELRDGSRAGALEIQRRYLEGVRTSLAEDPAPLPLWKARVLRDWEETLDLLEREPEVLADRLDWIAKRALVRAEVPDARDRAALERRGARVGPLGHVGRPAPARARLSRLARRPPLPRAEPEGGPPEAGAGRPHPAPDRSRAGAARAHRAAARHARPRARAGHQVGPRTRRLGRGRLAPGPHRQAGLALVHRPARPGRERPVKITSETVRELAELACLELSDEELETMRADLEAILEYVDLLGELDTEAVPPTAHVLDMQTPLRDDEVADVLPREEVLRNGPKHDQSSVIVPRVIE
jgi:proteasome accessory factor A